ncbi:MAG TPA: hypothetical protein VM099_07425, partial [Gemmatimonadaceae bacterium]|nr:hypothetical protein [Gemmatimonadaceae bacterium]
MTSRCLRDSFAIFACVVSAATPRGALSLTRPDRLVRAADSACESIAKSATGTLSVTAVARVEPFKSGESIPRIFASLVVEAISAHLVLPKPVQ